ncbi:MAG TPA: ATP-binding cassette domain-containing protein [Burkholderiaceae bacterium]|nr:ATP-binding cassette domain-containing protein [Burkholderiaceae bacterium]
MREAENRVTNIAVEARSLGKVVQDATGSLTILDDINLTIAAGETAAIVGASGSGKSTLLGLLAGLDLPTAGEVRIFGESMFALDEDGRAALRARSIGFVFQSFQLLPHLTALENVLLPLELTGRTPEGEDPVSAARSLLTRVGLGERLGHYPKYLSGGEQQRVALARAFVLRPPLLLADEPTGSLDARTGEAVIDLMFELNRERGSTLVLVTHDADIAGRCTRRIELAAGRIVTH